MTLQNIKGYPCFNEGTTLLNFWRLSQMCSLNCPSFTVTPFLTMNVGTFKLLNKITNSCQQTIHEKPTNPPTHHSSKRKTFSKYVHSPSFSLPYTKETKIFKHENLKQKTKSWNPKKVFLFHQKPHKRQTFTLQP